MLHQHQLNTPVLACAFSVDGRFCAVATPNSTIEVYRVPSSTCLAATATWPRVATLTGHDDPVTALDWSHPLGLLLSCSEDRNAFVFTPPEDTSSSSAAAPSVHLQEQDDSSVQPAQPLWHRQAVSARLSRAALCAAWAPSGSKFALGGADRCLSICSYSLQGTCYTSRLIRNAHDGPVAAVAWHHGNSLLASCSADGTCRVFSAYIPGVWKR